MQTVHLNCATWGGVREILVIILCLHQTFYRLQVSQESNCPIFTIIRDQETNFFFWQRPMCLLRILSGTDLGVYS